MSRLFSYIEIQELFGPPTSNNVGYNPYVYHLRFYTIFHSDLAPNTSFEMNQRMRMSEEDW